MKKKYCTQNNGDCKTCSLVNYGLDCRNIPLKAKAKERVRDKGPIHYGRGGRGQEIENA